MSHYLTPPPDENPPELVPPPEKLPPLLAALLARIAAFMEWALKVDAQ